MPEIANNAQAATLLASAAAQGDTLTLAPTINGTGSIGDASQSTVNIGVGSKTVGRTVTLPAGASMTQPYSVSLTPAPLSQQSQTFSAYFKVNSDKVEVTSETALAVWFKSLPPAMSKSITDGVTEVRIVGHASTTNDISYNRELSMRRALRIEAILRAYASSKAQLVHTAASFTDAKQFDPFTGAKTDVEDETERFVEVIVTFVNRP
jgi:outer membrane protein OmpA-like peptidoglycan-associated protein